MAQVTPNMTLRARKQELDKLADAWGLQTPPMHPKTKKAVDKINQWEVFKAEANFANPLDELLDADPKNWESIFDQTVAGFTRSMMIDAAHDRMTAGLEQRAATALKASEQVDHVLKALPLAKVQADYINAVETLGDTINDLAKAVDKDAEATATYRSSEKKIQAFQHWVAHALDLPALTAVAGLPDLWVLETWRGIRGDDARINYNEHDFHTHQRVLSAKDKTSTGKNLHLLAQEHWEGITFDMPTSHEELLDRAHNLTHAGKTQQFYSDEEPSGTGRVSNTRPPQRAPRQPQVTLSTF